MSRYISGEDVYEYYQRIKNLALSENWAGIEAGYSGSNRLWPPFTGTSEECERVRWLFTHRGDFDYHYNPSLKPDMNPRDNPGLYPDSLIISIIRNNPVLWNMVNSGSFGLPNRAPYVKQGNFLQSLAVASAPDAARKIVTVVANKVLESGTAEQKAQAGELLNITKRASTIAKVWAVTAVAATGIGAAATGAVGLGSLGAGAKAAAAKIVSASAVAASAMNVVTMAKNVVMPEKPSLQTAAVSEAGVFPGFDPKYLIPVVAILAVALLTSKKPKGKGRK